ncbi:signal peptide peptidase SppA [Nanoarchaeota archaeon]
MPKKRVQEEYPKTKWGLLVGILVIVFIIGAIFISIIVSLFDTPSQKILGSGNVAVIKVEGAIFVQKQSLFGDSSASSTEIVEFIEQASEDSDIDAILFEINSPGGSAVASDEIVSAIKKVDKPTISLIREVGASGAYWVASATDHIVANRMSLTGSVGVIGSYLEFSGLLSDYNLTYRRFVAGKYKDIGDPFRTMTPSEQEIIQDLLNEYHYFFSSDVIENRNIPKSNVDEITTGLFFSGRKAKELGLIDELGGKDEAEEYLEEKLNAEIKFIEYKKQPTFSDLLVGLFKENSFLIGRGIGSTIFQEKDFGILT